MPHVKRFTLVALVLALAAFGAIAAACGGGDDGTPAAAQQASIPTVASTATDFAIEAPDFFDQGLVRLTLANNGQEPHHLQVLKMKPTFIHAKFVTTIEQIKTALPTEGEAAFNRLYQIADFAGGPGAVDPGGSSEAVVSLDPGFYFLVCFIAGADGVPHILKGMAEPLTVNPKPGARQPAPPTAGATVELVDFAFTVVGATLPAGSTTFAITNKGQQAHEMAILRLKGITAADLRKMLTDPAAAPPEGPPPYEAVGGFQDTAPGGTGWTTVNLTAGEYVLICLIPDAASGKPHAALGMFKPLTVQ
jgi:uncharacterized cupredoxin-like copper-binding protein